MRIFAGTLEVWMEAPQTPQIFSGVSIE
jgi:hypothetical protein